jgi:hypothetical protein
MLKTIFLGLMLCVASAGFAQENPLAGPIDIHVHASPDSTSRSIDAIDLARLAKNRGMRGLVLKNHYEPTASPAYIVRKEVLGIEVFGGIDLNLSVGGMNPSAVEHFFRKTCSSHLSRLTSGAHRPSTQGVSVERCGSVVTSTFGPPGRCAAMIWLTCGTRRV